MKKKYKLKKKVKIILIIIFLLTLIITLNIVLNKQTKVKDINVVQKKEEKSVKKEINNELENIEEEAQEIKELQEEVYEEPVELSYTTRMTSYYPEEDTDCTGSGLCSWDFQVNDKGWYTYQGKLVVATATEYLLKYGFTLNEGVHTYKYGDEITLVIDGVEYQAIVLDSCGSSMKTDRVDLFVSNANSVKDTIIEVRK